MRSGMPWLLGVVALALAVPAARAQDASLQTCLDAAADFSPVYPTSEFPPGTKEVTAVWRLDARERFRELVGSFVAVDVGFAMPANYHILDARVSLGPSRAGEFHVEQPRPLPAGRYRLDVRADGQAWKAVDFAIEPNRQNGPDPPLQTFVPLAAGKVWRYDFTQAAGEGAHVSLPGVEPGPDGKLHATATYTVAGSDDAGTRIEMRRDDKLVLEEWWRAGANGLAVTQRRAAGRLVPFDPPQLFFAWPPGVRSWDWPTSDAPEHARFKMWGPVPIALGATKVAGYVVLMRAEQPDTVVGTIERQFVPTVGMVRERTVFQLGPVTALRQDVVLAGSGDGN